MNKMPDYTLEQKAAAFDKLWKNCGNGEGELLTYKLIYDSININNCTATRVPMFVFKLKYVGEAYKFKDVLHHLATSDSAPDL